jgi:hypothetical protein
MIKQFFKDKVRVLAACFLTTITVAAIYHLWPENWAIGILIGYLTIMTTLLVEAKRDADANK